jgi:hypothetical protein
MSKAPDFLRMPLAELRRWPARRICEQEPLVRGVRGTRNERLRVLTMTIFPDFGVTLRQMEATVDRLERILTRWVWDGWIVGIEVEAQIPLSLEEREAKEMRERGRH